jgi:mono/diheme cytochrome c family protein
MKKLVLYVFGIVFLAGCGLVPWRNVAPGPMMNPGNDWLANDRYESNGERIYFTATNDQGERIQYSGGQSFGGMMGGGPLACASCHGPDGRGGVHTMHMDVMEAPDIRYSAMSGEVDEHGDNNQELDDHADDHGVYDIEDFHLAVVEGKHPNGDDLSRDMPRWIMSDEELADLFDYLKSLP